jgi:hypothetical protein
MKEFVAASHNSGLKKDLAAPSSSTTSTSTPNKPKPH